MHAVLACEPRHNRMEKWKKISDFPEYEVSDLGRIRRVDTLKIRKVQVQSTGYVTVRLTRPGYSRTVSIHVEVALAFVGPRPSPRHEVNHIDSNRANPTADNLEWLTKSENRKHAYDCGYASAQGSRNGHSKLTDQGVLKIRKAAKTEYRNLSVELGVSLATIRDVAAHRTWTHL